MIDPATLTKRYYKIGEVADMFQVATSLIRYWESEFPQLKPMKGKSGMRRYQKEDVLMLDRIYTLVKLKGFKIKGAIKELEKKGDHDMSTSTGKEGLKKVRNELVQLKIELQNLKSTLK